MTSWLIFIPCAVFYAFGLWSDAALSVRYIFYKMTEANRLVDNKEGYFDPKKLWILVLIEVGSATGLGYLMHSLAGEQWGNVGLLTAGMTLAGAGLAHFLVSKFNAKTARQNRIKQINLRRAWKSNGGPPVGYTFAQNSGKYFVKSFAWIRGNTLAQLTAMLTDWLALPDDKAWPDTKYHPNGGR